MILFIEAKVVFEVFDKKYAGTVDAFYLGDMLRCLGIAATNSACEKKGQTAKTGGKQLSIDEFLAIYNEFAGLPATTWGVYEDFMECLKLYDKDQNGKLILSELSTVLVNMGICLYIFKYYLFQVLVINYIFKLKN
jgi:Ca2+-binding EF-hand superfamily protein